AASSAETPAPTAPEPSAAPPAAEPARAPAPAAPTGNGKAFVSPVVARIAGEHGIDPSQVPGTGTGGRVTKKDILAFVESGGAKEQPQAPAPTPAPPAQQAQPEAPAPQAPPPAQAPPPPKPKPPAPAPVAAGETLPGETVEPITAMRRGIAEHMR